MVAIFCNYVAMGELSINLIDMFFLGQFLQADCKKESVIAVKSFPQWYICFE